MNGNPYRPSDELTLLVSAYIDGSLDEPSNEKLQSMLLVDDDACRWFDKVLVLHSLLYLDGHHETLELPPKVIADIVPAVSGVDDLGLPIHDVADEAFSDTNPTLSRRWGGQSGGHSRLLMATAVSILICIVGAGYLWQASWDRPPYRGAEIASVKAEVGARFEYGVNGNPSPQAGTALKEGWYRLLDGLLEVEYDSGASLVIMSPAEFRLADEMTVELLDGRLSAEIPEPAIGFTVDTVGGSVVDYGTAFAVEARRGENSDVHVFEGEVRVDLVETEGMTSPLQLFAGHASRINPFSAIPSGIDLDSRSFVRHLGATENDYAQAVLELGPVVYYRMEPVGDGQRLEDSSPSAAHAKIHTSAAGGSPWTGGKVGAAFELGGPSDQTFAVADDYPKATDNELSVVCWVYAESRPLWASIAKNWGNPVTRGQFHFGLLQHSGELAAHIFDAATHKGHFDQESNYSDVCAQDSVPLPLHQWHHVAMVADGAFLRLYRNGREVASSPYEQLHVEPSLDALAVGTKLKDTGDVPAEIPGWSLWDGRLDELAIFNHALTPKQIRLLFEVSNNESSSTNAVLAAPEQGGTGG